MSNFPPIAGTYLAGRVCECKEYCAAPGTICFGKCENESKTTACPPPPCRSCGKWPPQFVRKCRKCGVTYYHWFGRFFYPYKFQSADCCWDCSKGEFEFFHEWRQPPACIFPTVSEMTHLFVEF